MLSYTLPLSECTGTGRSSLRSPSKGITRRPGYQHGARSSREQYGAGSLSGIWPTLVLPLFLRQLQESAQKRIAVHCLWTANCCPYSFIACQPYPYTYQTAVIIYSDKKHTIRVILTNPRQYIQRSQYMTPVTKYHLQSVWWAWITPTLQTETYIHPNNGLNTKASSKRRVIHTPDFKHRH